MDLTDEMLNEMTLQDEEEEELGGKPRVDVDVQSKTRPIQQTLALIKPDVVGKSDEIINILRREGLSVLQTRRVQLTQEQAAAFYQDMYETDWFAGAVSNLTSGPLLALILCGPHGVRHWLELIGPSTWKERSTMPNCLRAQYGKQGCDYDNALHGSANETDALRELNFFFADASEKSALSLPHPLSFNPLILEVILKFSKIEDVRRHRLVCKTWNYVILNLSNPKIGLAEKYFSVAKINDKFPFDDICHTMDANLARKVMGHPNDNHVQSCCTLMFSETIRYIAISSSIEETPIIHKIFESHLPNIKKVHLRFTYSEPPLQAIDPRMAKIPIKKKLESLKITVPCNSRDGRIAPVTTVAQLLVDASPNIRGLELTYVLPALTNNKKLESLVYDFGYGGPISPMSTQVNPKRLSNVLHQVASTLQHLHLPVLHYFKDFDVAARNEFLMPNMPKLQTFKSRGTDLFSSGRVIEGVFGQELKQVYFEVGHPHASENKDLESILASKFFTAPSLTDLSIDYCNPDIEQTRSMIMSKITKKAFPNLQRLSYQNWYWRNENGNHGYYGVAVDESCCKLDNALKTCYDLELKHFKIVVPLPRKLSSFINTLSKHSALFSGKKLKRFVIYADNIVDDWEFWNPETVGLFDGLECMSSMESVKICGLALTKATTRQIWKCITEKKIPIVLRGDYERLF